LTVSLTWPDVVQRRLEEPPNLETLLDRETLDRVAAGRTNSEGSVRGDLPRPGVDPSCLAAVFTAGDLHEGAGRGTAPFGDQWEFDRADCVVAAQPPPDAGKAFPIWRTEVAATAALRNLRGYPPAPGRRNCDLLVVGWTCWDVNAFRDSTTGRHTTGEDAILDDAFWNAQAGEPFAG
jgi:hypothetical protein